jgi:prefoldin alpha subunit
MEVESVNNIRNYEMFLSSILQEDLKFAFESREKLKQQMVEFDELRHTINLFTSEEMQTSGLHSSLNIGCDFFVDANVKDISKILLNIGAGIFFECTLDEASHFIAKKQKMLEHQIEYMTSKIAEIEGFIALYKSSLSLASIDVETEVNLSVAEQVPFICGPMVDSNVSAIDTVQNMLLNTLKAS